MHGLDGPIERAGGFIFQRRNVPAEQTYADN
jgi:hypothetical protein